MSRVEAAFPPRSAVRTRGERMAGMAAEALLDVRQLAAGTGRVLDRESAEQPARRVLVIGVYARADAAMMRASVEALRGSRHRLAFALGSLDETAPSLSDVTALAGLSGGKYANLNRLAATAQPLACDWILVLDDDVRLSRNFLDRLVVAGERLGLQMLQPALRRSSHTAWQVTRRRASLARRTRFVEIGPVVLLHRDVYRELAPFPEEGMGWGLDLHWAALAEQRGWRLGVVDAVPVRHEARATGSAYSHEEAMTAATEYLAGHEHLEYAEAEQTLETYRELPR